MTHADHVPRVSAEDRAELASLIAEAALLRGTFTLRSGRVSSYYLDKYLFTTQPGILTRLGDMLAERIATMDAAVGRADRLAGAELGGIPLVTAASMATGRPCLFVRNQKKDYGTAKQLEGGFKPGERAVLLEDVATTAGQAIEAVGSLRDVGLEVGGIIAVIDREEGARENVEGAGLRFDALFTKTDLGVNE
ncbi:MAG: orotate phosphoribosyltransferase [Planctomycetota bacterium]